MRKVSAFLLGLLLLSSTASADPPGLPPSVIREWLHSAAQQMLKYQGEYEKLIAQDWRLYDVDKMTKISSTANYWAEEVRTCQEMLGIGCNPGTLEVVAGVSTYASLVVVEAAGAYVNAQIDIDNSAIIVDAIKCGMGSGTPCEPPAEPSTPDVCPSGTHGVYPNCEPDGVVPPSKVPLTPEERLEKMRERREDRTNREGTAAGPGPTGIGPFPASCEERGGHWVRYRGVGDKEWGDWQCEF